MRGRAIQRASAGRMHGKISPTSKLQAESSKIAHKGPHFSSRHSCTTVGASSSTLTSAVTHIHRHACPCTSNAAGPIAPPMLATASPVAPTNMAAMPSRRMRGSARAVTLRMSDRKGRAFTVQSLRVHSGRNRNWDRSRTMPSHSGSMTVDSRAAANPKRGASAMPNAATIPASAPERQKRSGSSRQTSSSSPGSAIKGCTNRAAAANARAVPRRPRRWQARARTIMASASERAVR